jgi:hypothetical protein
MKKHRNHKRGELYPEYDPGQLLKGAVRGKYTDRHHAGANPVLLDLHLRKAFQ